MRFFRLWALRGRKIRFLERCIEQQIRARVSDEEYFNKELNRLEDILRDIPAQEVSLSSDRYRIEWLESEHSRLQAELQEWKDRAALYYASWKAGIKDEK